MGDGTRLIVLSDPIGRPGTPSEPDGPGAIRSGADGRRSDAPGPPDARARGPQRFDARHPDLVALPVPPGEPAAGLRSRRRRGLPPGPARRGLDALGARRDHTVRLVRYGGRARAAVSGLSPDERLARYGPDDGRPGPPGRHGPVGPGRRGPPGARRRADLGLRQDHPAPDDPGVGRSIGARRGRRRRGRRRSRRSACVKADIGIKDGRIVGVGRAGNPAISDGIELAIGPHTAPVSWATA